MDITKTVTHVSLCAGYGGIDFGLKRAIPNLRTIAFSEIEAYACANLVAKMEAGLLDAAPIWTNLKTFPWAGFCGKVDILSGGYPCQPFSAAGKRLGTADPRHLWPFIANGIALMQPRVCFFENVEGHISLGLRAVIEELGSLGYETTWGIFSAREVGAPHQRKRVFILAHLRGEGLSRHWGFEQIRLAKGRTVEGRHASSPSGFGIQTVANKRWPSRPGESQHGWEPPRVVGDTKHNGSHQCDSEARGKDSSSEQGWMQESERGSASVGDAEGWQDHGRESRDLAEESRCGTGGDHAADCTGEELGNAKDERCGRMDDEPSEVSGGETRRHIDGASTTQQKGQRQTQPSLGGDTDGSPGGLDYAELCITCDNRTDELRLLGNGVVPATAERAFLILSQQK